MAEFGSELWSLMMQQQQEMLARSQYGLAAGTAGGFSSGAPLSAGGGWPGPFGLMAGPLPPWLGSLRNVIQWPMMLAGGFMNQYAMGRGFVPTPIFGRYDYYDLLRNQHASMQMMAGMEQAQAIDTRWLGSLLYNNAALAAPRGTDLQSLEIAQRHAAASAMNIAGPMARALLSVPGILGGPLEGILGHPFGGQFLAAHTYLAGRQFVREDGVGFTPQEIGSLTSGMARFFRPNERYDVSRAQGFNLAQLGGIYEEAARRGLMETPIQAENALRAMGRGGDSEMVLRRLGESHNAQISDLAKTLAMVSEMTGPGQSISSLFESLERLTQSPLRRIGPERARQLLTELKEVSRVTGLSVDTLTDMTSGTLAQGRMFNVAPATAGRITTMTVLGELAYRNQTGGQTGPGVFTPMEYVQRFREEAVAGMESQMGTAVANLIAWQRSTGQELGPNLQNLITAFTSTDPAVLHSAASQAARGRFTRVDQIARALQEANPGMTYRSARDVLLDSETANTARQALNPQAVLLARVNEFTRTAPASLTSVDAEQIAQRTGMSTRDVFRTVVDELSVNGAGSNEDVVVRIATRLGVSRRLAATYLARFRSEANRSAVLEGVPGAANGFDVFRLLSGQDDVSRLNRVKDVGSAFSEALRGTSLGGANEGLINRLMDAAMDPHRRDWGERLLDIFGQQRLSDFFSTATNADVDAAAREWGVQSNDAQGRMRSRGSIAVDIATRINEDLESNDPGTTRRAWDAAEKLFGSEQGNGIGGLLLAAGLHNRLQQMRPDLKITGAEVKAYLKRHGGLTKILGDREWFKDDLFATTGVSENVAMRDRVRAAAGMAMTSLMFGKGGELRPEDIKRAADELKILYEEDPNSPGAYRPRSGLENLVVRDVAGLFSDDPEKQRVAVQEILNKAGRMGYLGNEFLKGFSSADMTNLAKLELGGKLAAPGTRELSAQADKQKKKGDPAEVVISNTKALAEAIANALSMILNSTKLPAVQN